MIDAYDAPMLLIPEKIKKFAAVASTIDKRIRARFDLPEVSNVFIDTWSRKRIGNSMIAVTSASTKRSVIADVPERIF